jgi:hypothetical protein
VVTGKSLTDLITTSLLGKTRYISAARATSQAKEDPDLAVA